jgi:hypothetical protein
VLKLSFPRDKTREAKDAKAAEEYMQPQTSIMAAVMGEALLWLCYV